MIGKLAVSGLVGLALAGATMGAETNETKKVAGLVAGYVFHEQNHNVLMANYLKHKDKPKYADVGDLLNEFVMFHQANGWAHAGGSTWIQNARANTITPEFAKRQNEYIMQLRAKVEELRGSDNFDPKARYKGQKRK